MINNAYHRKIAKDVRKMEQEAITNEKQNGVYESPPKDAMPVATLSKLTGYEKDYVKQVPVVSGSGRPNMEMDPDGKLAKKRGRKPKAPVLSMIYQQQVNDFKGGSINETEQSEEEDRDRLEEVMGAGLVPADLVKHDAEKNYARNLTAGAKRALRKKAPEVVAGSVILEAVEEDKPKQRRGRKPKPELEAQKEPSPVKAPSLPIMKRRANKIKEIMKSKQMTMIAASKYIKDNGIKY